MSTAAHAAPDPNAEPIAVVGVGLRFPGGCHSFDDYVAFLAAGRSGIVPLPTDRWDVDAFTPTQPGEAGKIATVGGGFLDRIDDFDAAFFNISPKEAQYIDPQQRMVLETAWQALEHAGIDPTPLRRGNGSVYVGASSIDYALELDGLDYPDLDGHLAAGITMFPMSGRLSYFLGWRGPSATVDTACSSSLTALHMAVGGLRAGETDIALCGGVNAIHHPRITVMFSHAQMLAPDALCKTFDDAADGYVRAEGCGMLVLKRLSSAVADGDRVLAVIRGTAIGQDGESAGLTVPNGNAQTLVMQRALAAAGVTAGDIQYVEAHGTGTPLGDPIELGGINDVFAASHTAEDPLIVGSVKTNLGHMEPASGVVGLIKVIAQLRERTIFRHLNLATPSARIPWDRYPIEIPTEARPWDAPVRRAVVNSFGFAGAIGAAVLEQAPEPSPTAARQLDGDIAAPQRPRPGVLAVSARSVPALRARLEQLRDHVAERPELEVPAVCAAANTGRAHFAHRVALTAVDRDGLVGALDRSLAELPTASTSGLRRIAFFFGGQGTQYAGMGAAAYERFSAFRETVDECEALFAPHLERSVRDLLLGHGEGLDAIDETAYTQPALFVLELALARLWASWGVRPSVVAGHSIGELTAATVAGVFSLPDAVRVVAARGRLMQSVTTPGGMIAVNASSAEIEEALAGHADLAVAAVNAPRQTVVSGAAGALAELAASLRADGHRVEALAVSHAFHSPLMAEVYEEFRAVLADVEFGSPEMSLISNVTGTALRAAQAADPDYWVGHIGSPVLFMDGARAALRRGRHAVIEIGPSSALTALARQAVPAEDHVWITSLRRREADSTLPLVRALGEFYQAGGRVDWDGVHADDPASHVTLPTYPFQRSRFWLPTPTGSGPVESVPGAHPLLGAAVTADAPVLGEFEISLSAASAATAAPVEELRGGGVEDDETTSQLPFTALLELVLAAQDACLGHTGATVEDLVVHEAVTLPAELRTRLTDTGIEVFSAVGDERRLHLSATLDTATAVIMPPAGDPDTPLPDPGSITVAGADLAVDLAAVGREYGTPLPVPTSITIASDGVVRVQLPARRPRPHEHLPVDTVEAALLALGATSLDGPACRVTAVERLRMWRKPRGTELYLTARPVPSDVDGQRRFACTIADNRGPVAALDGVTLTAPDDPSGRERFVHRQHWVDSDEAAGVAPVRHVLLLSDTLAPGLDERPGLRVSRRGIAASATELGAEIARLVDDGVTDVCWAWHGGTAAPTEAGVRAEAERNIAELLRVVAALASRRVRLWLITRGAQRVEGDPTGNGSGLAASALWGFGSTLLNEMPQLRPTLLDLDAELDAAADVETAALAAELARPETAEYRIAYRHGRRLVRRLLPADATAGRRVTPRRLRADRSYVILGGLGGLGVASAAELVACGARELVLVSRSGRVTAEVEGPLASLRDRARIRIVAADIGAPGAVGELLAGVAGDGPPVAGIVHAAGAVGKDLVAQLDWPAVAEHLAPKMFGAWAVHEATRDLPELEFLAFYSSIAGVIGGVTQAHYAAGSTYLEALAEWRSAAGLPGVALSWGAWASLGMSARLDAGLTAEIGRGGINFFSPHRGLRALRELLTASGAHVVGSFDWDRVSAAAAVDHPLFRAVAAPRAAVGVDLSELLALPHDQLVLRVAGMVRDGVGKALHLDDSSVLDPDAEVRTFGLDSLMSMEVKSGLDRALGLSLPASLAFDHPTITAMTSFVTTTLTGVTASSETGAAR